MSRKHSLALIVVCGLSQPATTQQPAARTMVTPAGSKSSRQVWFVPEKDSAASVFQSDAAAPVPGVYKSVPSTLLVKVPEPIDPRMVIEPPPRAVPPLTIEAPLRLVPQR